MTALTTVCVLVTVGGSVVVVIDEEVRVGALVGDGVVLTSTVRVDDGASDAVGELGNVCEGAEVRLGTTTSATCVASVGVEEGVRVGGNGVDDVVSTTVGVLLGGRVVCVGEIKTVSVGVIVRVRVDVGVEVNGADKADAVCVLVWLGIGVNDGGCGVLERVRV